MAVYKVLQDIEAEDKLLGPLTLKQFIFAIIVVAFGFVGFLLFRVNPILAIPVLPPMIVFGFLAAPLGRDQPNEIWLAARIRFFLKPKLRIWDQNGIKELVTITAPKQIQQVLTNYMTQNEVRSRLHALADTLDSRGWAVKNAHVNMYAHPSYAAVASPSSDRLLPPAPMPASPASQGLDINAADDIMDAANNPVAQNFDRMMQASAQEHRQQIVAHMQTVANPPAPAQQQPAPDYWFMYQGDNPTPPPPGYATFDSQVVSPHQESVTSTNTPLLRKTDTDEEAALLARLKKPDTSKAHLKTIMPLSDQEAIKLQQAARASVSATPPSSDDYKILPSNDAQKAAVSGQNPAMTANPPPAILELANNDEWSVATLAGQAKRVQEKDLPDDEVVIPLH